MKKYLLLLAAVTLLFSCEKSVEFNNPAFQGFINGTIWKANAMQATKGTLGSLKITGSSASGLMEIKLNSTTLEKRILGVVGSANSISFSSLIDNPNFKYVTQAASGPANSITLSSGGTGYTTSSLVPTTGGSGTGLKVDFQTNTSGVITSITVNSAGNFYKAGDIVTVTGGGANATFLVLNTTNTNGEVFITEFDGVTISGNYKFIAYDAAANPKTAVCREGLFYKVPVN